jgi:Histidine kinase-, DNA gyrase B-, and HSP90-like ATPase
MPRHHVLYSSRAFNQDASNAMKGDIVRGLVELITNSDDAYGDDAHGKIRIEVEHRRNHPWQVIVRDRARGMRKAKMEHAIGDIGTRTSGFESGARVRGNLGRGAKDLAAFGPVTFESICDGRYTQMVLEPDGSFDDLVERRVTDEDRELLGVPRGNGTVVSVLVGERIRCPKHATLLDKLSKHYQLRDVNSDPRRELTLVDLNDGTSDGIRYGRPSLTEVASSEVTVPDYDDVTASVTIWRAAERYENPSSDSGRPEGLLIKGRRAIYENTLFSFEGNLHAHWFTGEVTCEYIDALAREYDDVAEAGEEHSTLNPIPIIGRSRDGLEHEHPFFKAFTEAVEPVLVALVHEEERRAREGEVRESARLRRALDSLGRDLGQLVDADLREIDEDGLGGGRGGDGTEPLRIIPESPVLYMGEGKTLSVVALRDLGAETIDVEVDPEGVIELIDSTPIPLTDHPRREECLIARIRVRPLIEDEETLLTVRCGDAEAVCSVEVRPERENPDPQLPEELEFERPRYQLAHGRRRSLLLRAPVDVINEADTTVVRVVSSDQGVVVLGGDVDLGFSEDELCFLGRVQVDPRVLGTRATLTATLGDANARCEVVVAQNEGGGPRLQIKIVDEAQGRFRAYVERGPEVTTIKILGGHSAIKRYLGPGPDFPNQESVQARLVIAEIVAGEAARLVMEKKYRAPGDLDGPAFYADHLLYMEKYLQRCHRMMLADNEQT